MRYIVALLFLSLPSTAIAASSEWFETTGAKLRLIARDIGGGRVEAAFQIALDDGWKTYWKVPGSSGVPPQIALAIDPFGTPLSADTTVEIHYPVPIAFSDGVGWAAGYKQDVAFPIDVGGAHDLDTLYASGLIGICADICIPVQFNLNVALDGSAQSNAEEQRILTEARMRLPVRSGDRRCESDRRPRKWYPARHRSRKCAFGVLVRSGARFSRGGYANCRRRRDFRTVRRRVERPPRARRRRRYRDYS